MAYNLNDVPEGVRDILEHMTREMQQRVLADYETHYAPFLNMLAGWKGAVQEHYSMGEESAINRLQEQFFPLGDWKFPSQGLAVPQRPAERTTDVVFGAELKDPATRSWTTCGEGWLQPTSLREGFVRQIDNDYLVVLEVDYLGDGPLEPLLARGQLAFTAATEEFLGAMNSGVWWLQTPGKPARLARFNRYSGYTLFEQEMATARMNQRQLDFWLPACFPYSRKMVRLALPGGTQKEETPPPTLRALGEPRSGFRFVGVVNGRERRNIMAMRAHGAQKNNGTLFQLNAVPVVQAAVEDELFYPPFQRISNEYARRLSGVNDLFAAVVYNDSRVVPASMIRVPSNDPTKPAPDVQVQFAQFEAKTARVKLYYNSSGQERSDNSTTPSMLEMPPVRYQVPYRVIGGMTVNGAKDRAEWARTAWYHTVLRPPMLTEGDITEVIRQRKAHFGDLIRFKYATREILHEPDEGNAHWRSYLWPSVISKEGNFDARYGEIPAANYMPLIQSLRLAFERGPASPGVPEFLLSDVANYLASYISQYFVLSTFRIEGRVV